MKTRILIIISIVIGFFILPQAFGITEEQIHGSSSFDMIPTELIPGKPTTFEIKFQYTTGPYALDNLIPVIEVNPASAISNIQIDAQPVGVAQKQIIRIPVTITVDPQIEHEKIFLSVSFAGDHFSSRSDAIYKSSWTESITFDIAPKDTVGIPLGDCIPIDIPYTVSGGDIFTVCKSDSLNSVRVIVDAISNGTVAVDIPQTMLYALGDTECNVTNDFFVLMHGEEILANITATENGNLVKVDFTKGIHEIEIIGASIVPSPAPAQYCGIVEGYEKKFLAPLDQTDRGVAPDSIRCNEGLVLVKKIDNTPACVKPESITKLVERSWAKPPASMFRDDT